MNSNIQTAHFMTPHPGQHRILASPARYKVVACGRRFGKTETAKMMLMYRATVRREQTWWLAPTYQMASQVWRDLKTTLTNVTGITISESERRMDFAGGGLIAIRSTHTPDNLRGAGLDYAVLDEAAFMEPRVWPEVVRPMLLERQGGALFLSTPFGRNHFWQLYQLGLDPQEPEWESFHFTSLDNPLIPPDEFDQIRRTTPQRVWREEYLAEFVEDAGQVFQGVREAATAAPTAEPLRGHRYIMGCDWGREGDYTALAIVDATTQAMVALERFRGVSWSHQRGRLRNLANKWGVALIWAEANSMGTVLIEDLQRAGLPVRPFMTTLRSKAPLIEGLSLAIERGDLALLPDEVLLSELAAYTLERLPGGGYRYSAPAGMHDDTVMATALAWYGVQTGGLRLDFA